MGDLHAKLGCLDVGSEVKNGAEIPEGMKYFIVGLSGGITEQDVDGRMCLPLDILRYAEALREGGKFVLFDVMGWEEAASEMEGRLQDIIKARKLSEVQVVKASEVIEGDPERYQEIFQDIKRMVLEDPCVADKMWKIVPPSAKNPNGFDSKLPFADLEPGERECACELMEYEMHHIAFILFNDGTKILHGTAEKKSRQIVNLIAADDWKGQIIDPPEVRSNGGLPPYALHSFEDVSLDGRQVPLRAALDLGDSVRAQGDRFDIGKYLGKSSVVPEIREVLDGFDADDSKSVYLGISSLVVTCLWPVEKAELERLKVEDPEKFEVRVHMKITEMIESMSLSPQLKLVLENFILDDLDMSDARTCIHGLLSDLGGDDGVVRNLTVLHEREVMERMMEILNDLHGLVGGEWLDLRHSDLWRVLQEIDHVFNEGRFFTEEIYGDGIVDDPFVREESIERIRAVMEGLNLREDIHTSHMYLSWAMRGIGDFYRGLSGEARDYMVEKVILPYLVKRGDEFAVWVQDFVLGKSYSQFTLIMFADELVEKFTEARRRDLGLDFADSVFESCEAMDRLGLTQRATWRSIQESMRVIATVVKKSKSAFSES